MNKSEEVNLLEIHLQNLKKCVFGAKKEAKIKILGEINKIKREIEEFLHKVSQEDEFFE